MNTVIQAGQRRRWLTYHTYNSQRSNRGFPDLIMLRDDRVIAAELKQDGEKPTPEQLIWLRTFVATGKVEVYVWAPADWSEVDTVLK